MSFTAKIKVRYAETDQMGVVHHSVYPIYYELARAEMLEAKGLPYHKMEIEQNIVMPVRKLEIDYLKSAFFGDELSVKVSIEKISAVQVILYHEVFNQNNELINKGHIKLGFSDKTTGKIVRLPEHFLQYFTN